MCLLGVAMLVLGSMASGRQPLFAGGTFGRVRAVLLVDVRGVGAFRGQAEADLLDEMRVATVIVWSEPGCLPTLCRLVIIGAVWSLHIQHTITSAPARHLITIILYVQIVLLIIANDILVGILDKFFQVNDLF